MTFMGKLSAYHKLLADSSLHRTEWSQKPDYCIIALLNTSCFLAQMSVRKKTNYALFQDYLEVYGCEKVSKLTFTFIPYSPGADGNHVGCLY